MLYPNMSFRTFLDGFNHDPHLPLVHTTKCKVFEDYIAPSNCLVPRNCDCFKENLLYFFYGRPAYRVNCDKTLPMMPEQRPVCIIMKPDFALPVKRIFPFDSGAWYAGLYDGYFNPAGINDYDLGNDLVLTSAVVSAFFSNNKNYVQGNVLDGLAIDATETDVEAYYNLIRNFASAKKTVSISDDRRYSIEVQTSSEVCLKNSSGGNGKTVLTGEVLAVAGPASLLDDKNLYRVIRKEWKAEFIPYYPASLHTEEVVHGSLWQGVVAFFNRYGLLN